MIEHYKIEPGTNYAVPFKVISCRPKKLRQQNNPPDGGFCIGENMHMQVESENKDAIVGAVSNLLDQCPIGGAIYMASFGRTDRGTYKLTADLYGPEPATDSSV